MPGARPKRLDAVMGAVCLHPWMITEDKLCEIQSFLTRAQLGDLPDEEEIRETIEAAYGHDLAAELGRGELAAIGERDIASREKITIGGVRIIQLYGTITNRSSLFASYSGGSSTIQIEGKIKEALKDDEVRGILIDVDSPGGSVLGVAELASLIREAREQKPITAIARGNMASAAYYIGSAAGKVYATESSLVGSIGVLRIHTCGIELYKKAGISHRIFRSVPGKADLNPYEPISEKAAATAQATIDQMHAKFAADVSANRNMDADRVKTQLADGRYHVASVALELGMIDGIKSFAEALAELQNEPMPGGSVNTTASLPTAGINPAAHTSSRAAGFIPVVQPIGGSQVNAKIKAALFARGMTASADVEDTLATAVVSSFFAGAGVAVPENDDATLAKLLETKPQASADQPKPPEKPPEKPEPKADQVDPAKIVAEERERVRELTETAELLGIEKDDLNAAIEDGTTLAEAQKSWKKKIEEKGGVVPIKATGSAMDHLVKGASEGILASVGFLPHDQLSAEGRQFAGASLMNIARNYLGQCNIQIGLGESDEDIAEKFIKAQFPERGRVEFGSIHGASLTLASQSRNPAVFDAIVHKIMLTPVPLAEAKYKRWTQKVEDLKDLRMEALVNTGEFQLLSLSEDKQEAEEADFGEETYFMKAERYRRKAGMTPTMVANDDRGFFKAKIATLIRGVDKTINIQLIELLKSNPVLPDGLPLFHDNHGNVVNAGGPPKLTQNSLMRLTLGKQLDVSGRDPADYTLDWVFVPLELQTQAEQEFWKLPQQIPTTSTEKNVFQGSADVIADARLSLGVGEEAGSSQVWYGGSKDGKAIVYAFQSGWGGGRLRRWIHEPTMTVFYEVESRHATGVANFRPIVRNAGTGEGGG